MLYTVSDKVPENLRKLKLKNKRFFYSPMNVGFRYILCFDIRRPRKHERAFKSEGINRLMSLIYR